MSEPIDVALHAARKRIEQARGYLAHGNCCAAPVVVADTLAKLLGELADEAEKLADYIGQPDMEKVALHHALTNTGARTAVDMDGHQVGADPEEDDDLRYTFSMQAVVDRVRELADNDVIAYVEMTGGWVATIYAGARDQQTGDPILYALPEEAGGPFGRWPIMAGPGSYDPSGKRDHVASLDEFFIGPDTELAPAQAGPPFAPPEGEYAATREDDVDSLARKLIAAVRAWESGEIPREKGVIRWPGR